MKIVKPRVAPDTRIPAIGYIRVSLAREEMISPELQRTAILAWAKRTGHRIVEWIEDLDKTGRNFKRKIMKAIECVERGEVKVIAVWKYSRFGRNRAGIEINLARIETAGGQLLSATEEVDATTSSGWFQRDVIFSVATFESKRAGEQWKETHEWRREEGLPSAGKPRFGYIWHQRRVYDPDGTSHPQEERYEPDPETGPVVADLYQRHLDGVGYRALATWLNERGYRTSYGNQWTYLAVRRYMDSGFPAGYLRVHSGCSIAECAGDCSSYQLIKHPTKHHPQLITDATWTKYLAHRERSRGKPWSSSGAKHPFSGFPRCCRCGGGMKRVGTAATATTLGCRRRNELGPTACEGSHVRIADLRQGVLAFLKEIAEPHINRGAEAANLPAQEEPLPKESEQERLEAQAARLDRAIGKAMRSYAMADDDDPDGILEAEHKKLLGELRDEKAQLAVRLRALSPETAGEQCDKRQQAVRVAFGLVEEWRTISPQRANTLLRSVIEEIVVQPDHGGFEIRPAWEAGVPWMWEGPGRSTPKRELIKALWLEHPEATGPAIAELLAEQGVSVASAYAILVRNQMSEEHDPARYRRYSQGGRLSTDDQKEREKVRLEAARRFAAGEPVPAVADDLGVTKSTAWRWHRVWRTHGEDGLRSKTLPAKRV